MSSPSDPDIIQVLNIDPFTTTEDDVSVPLRRLFFHFFVPPTRVEVRFHPVIVDDVFVPCVVILFLHTVRVLP